jgi:tetratricopeptide (TPR) repeat protein
VTGGKNSLCEAPIVHVPAFLQGRGANWLFLLLAVATLLAFYPALGCGFVNYDDGGYVYDNSQVKSGLTARTIAWAWSTVTFANWHPLTWLSLMLDTELFGVRPWAYHSTNLLLHLANVMLLFLLLRRLTGAIWRSFSVAALFAVHPLHVESVVWVSERKDVLSTFFGLLALLAYERYARRPGLYRYLLIVLAMALSLMAKPMLVTLPFVLLLLDYWPLRRWQPDQAGAAPAGSSRSRRLLALLVEKIPLLLLGAASSGVTVWAQSRRGAVQSLEQHPLSFRIANSIVSYAQYLWQTIWPMDLAVFYPFPQGGLPFWQVVMAGMLLLAVTGVALAWCRRYPYLLVGWLFFLGTLVPVIGLVQVGQQARADRYTYVPLIGIFLMFSWGAAVVGSSAGRRQLLSCLAGLVLVLLVARSNAEARVWHDSLTLWNHALKVSESYVAHCNRGCFLLRQGQVKAAERDFRAALRLCPTDAESLTGLGVIFGMRGQIRESEHLLRTALAHCPDHAEAHANLGQCLLQKGEQEEAVRQLQEALRLRRDWPAVRDLLRSVEKQ